MAEARIPLQGTGLYNTNIEVYFNGWIAVFACNDRIIDNIQKTITNNA